MDFQLSDSCPTPSESQSSAISLGSDKISRTSAAHEGGRMSNKHVFKSYQLRGKYEQPWLTDKRLMRTKYNNYIVWGFLITALLLSGLVIWLAASKLPVHEYCQVLDDQFSTLNGDVWNHEVQVNGFGTGSFDWTTNDTKNSFVDSDGLHIVPTLTVESTQITNDQIFNGFTLNTTKGGGDGTCTATEKINEACSIRSNLTTGIIIPPIRSARLNTKGKISITYGRVEVVARIGAGDWLWPAIWMMPEDSVYGQWPVSGEIDIMESRGNNYTYPGGGYETLTSTLHWGPTPKTDSFWRTGNVLRLRRTNFAKGFHTFGLEWSEKYLFTYLDSRLAQVLYVDFRHEDMWKRGKFEQRMENSTLLTNPWAQAGRKNTPFDQKFFLVLNVAVGARNGWFPDSVGNKPWVDAATSAASDFYHASGKWVPTWNSDGGIGMTVRSVRMWQQGKCSSGT